MRKLGNRKDRRRGRLGRLQYEALETRRLLAADGIIPPPDQGDTLATAGVLELEPNHLTSVAELIGNNDFGSGDVDIFRIELLEGDHLLGHTSRVEFLAAGVPLPPLPDPAFVLRLFDGEGNELAASPYLPRPAVDPLPPAIPLEFIAPSDGEFFVGVSGIPNFSYDPTVPGSGEGDTIGGYALGLHLNRIEPADDIGDTIDSADFLPLDPNHRIRVEGLVGDNEFETSDVDMFSIELAEGDTLHAQLASAFTVPGVILPRLTGVLRVFDAGGEELAISPVPEGDAVGDVGLLTAVDYTATVDGHYFIGVSSMPNIRYDPLVAGSGEGESQGRYELSLGSRRVEPADDFGDTLSTAELILLEPGAVTRVEETLGNNEFGPSDVDLVQIELSADDRLTAHLTSIVPIPAGIALGAGVLRVFNEAGDELAVSTSRPLTTRPRDAVDGTVFLGVELTLDIADEGTYFLGVSSFPNLDYDPREPNSGVGEHVGHYVLEVQRGRIDPDDEVGDTLETALPIELRANSETRVDESIGNNRFGPLDVDLYQLRLREGDELTSRFVPLPDGQDGLRGALRMFDADGNEIASSGAVVLPGAPIVPTPPIQVTVPEDGTYYVGVSSLSNLGYDPNRAGSGEGRSTGVYEIGFELRRTPPPVGDVGDTIPTARRLPVGPDLHAHADELLGNNRFTSSDVDIYQVALEEGDQINAHLSGLFVPAPGTTPVFPHGILRLFDAEGIELAATDHAPLPRGIPHTELLLEFNIPADGEYFIGVSSFPNSNYDPLIAGSGLGIGIGPYGLMVHVDRTILPEDVGDTLAKAQAISIDDEGIAHAEEFIGNNEFEEADVDMYYVELTAGDVLEATLNHPNLDGFLGLNGGALRAFDGAGNELAISGAGIGNPAGDFSNIRVRFVAPEDGEFFVGVSSSGNTSYDPLEAGSGEGTTIGHYLLDVRRERPNQHDAGDTLETARSIEVVPGSRRHLDEVVGNNPHGSADVDLFEFGLAAGDTFRAVLVGSPLPVPGLVDSRLHGVLRAFNANGEQVAASVVDQNDDGALPPVVSAEFVAPQEGKYFIGVSSFPNVAYDPFVAGSGEGDSVGHYFLGLDIVRRFPPSDDVGDVMELAEPIVIAPNSAIEVTESIGNNSWGTSDVDLFRADLKKDDVLGVRLGPPVLGLPGVARLEGLLRVFDSGGVELAASLQQGGVRNSVLEVEIPADGTYFIGVSSFPNLSYDPRVAGSGSGGSVGPYELEVWARRAGTDPDPDAENPRNQLTRPRRFDRAIRALRRRAEADDGPAAAIGLPKLQRQALEADNARQARNANTRIRNALAGRPDVAKQEELLELLAEDVNRGLKRFRRL